MKKSTGLLFTAILALTSLSLGNATTENEDLANGFRVPEPWSVRTEVANWRVPEPWSVGTEVANWRVPEPWSVETEVANGFRVPEPWSVKENSKA